MKRVAHVFLFSLLVMAASVARVASADDSSQAVTLVATDALEGTPFEQTVIVVAPLPNGGHVGFIINRPTDVKLATLFPDDASSRRVDDPVSFGGPMLPSAVFALTHKAPDGDSDVVTLMPGLVAVLDAAGVDHILETTPNDARYFVGLVVWSPEELTAQVDGGVWDVKPADPNLVLRAKSGRLWQELRGSKSKTHGDNWV
jgi:putative transcriptional regulator